MRLIYELHSMDKSSALFVSHTHYLGGADRFYGFYVTPIYDNSIADNMGDIAHICRAIWPGATGFVYGDDHVFNDADNNKLAAHYFGRGMLAPLGVEGL